MSWKHKYKEDSLQIIQVRTWHRRKQHPESVMVKEYVKSYVIVVPVINAWVGSKKQFVMDVTL